MPRVFISVMEVNHALMKQDFTDMLSRVSGVAVNTMRNATALARDFPVVWNYFSHSLILCDSI